jgi:hypothetical protein
LNQKGIEFLCWFVGLLCFKKNKQTVSQKKRIRLGKDGEVHCAETLPAAFVAADGEVDCVGDGFSVLRRVLEI